MGVWQKLTDKFLVGAGDTYSLGATGGEATHTHRYGFMLGAWHYGLVGDDPRTGVLDMSSGSESTIGTFRHICGYYSFNHPNFSGNTNTGTYGAHQSIGKTTTESTLPPYQAVFMWQRIS